MQLVHRRWHGCGDGGRTLKAHDDCHGIALRIQARGHTGVKQLRQSNGDVAVNLQVLDALTKVAERSRKLVDLYAERITVTLVWPYRAGTNHSD